MKNNIIKIFKNFVKKHKIFISISFFISVRIFILYFIISVMEKLNIIKIPDSKYFSIPLLYEIIMKFLFYDISKGIHIDANIIHSVAYTIVFFVIGKVFLKKEIENIADEKDWIKYKAICYCILFSICFILNYANLIFLDYSSK